MSDPDLFFRQAGEACESGDFARGAALYRQLLAALPGHPQVLSALGNAEIGLGEVAEGVATLRRSLAIYEPQPDTWCNLARGLRLLRQYEEALAAADRTLALAPALFEAWMVRGNIAFDMERLDEALKAYEKAQAVRPGDACVYFNAGNVLHRLGRLGQAAGAYALAVQHNPDYAEAHLAQAKVLDSLAHPQEALAAIDRALALRPEDTEVLFIRGTILASLDRKEEAALALGEVLARDPSHVEAFRWRGLVYQKLERHADAVADLSCALELRSDYPEAEFDRAYSLAEMKRIEEAVAGYDRVLAAVPGHDLAGFNRSLLLLMRGDFAVGWQGYERRWANKEAAANRVVDKPRWTGAPDVGGKTILVWAEQGYGDCIQFCRYVPMLAAMGAHVVFEAPPRLVPLLKSLKGAASVIATGDPRPDYDLQCPVMSLPLAFKTRLETVPADVPYLSADPAKTAVFATGPAPRIGIVWEAKAATDKALRRAMPLAALEPVVRRPLAFHAVQKEIDPADAATLAHWKISQHADEQNDFSDAAALITTMDLMITVDTAVAHLAGALGRPVWLMLPYVAEWRWLTDRDDSPWYPTMRLFRQTAPRDWDGVAVRVAEALDRKFAAV